MWIAEDMKMWWLMTWRQENMRMYGGTYKWPTTQSPWNTGASKLSPGKCSSASKSNKLHRSFGQKHHRLRQFGRRPVVARIRALLSGYRVPTTMGPIRDWGAIMLHMNFFPHTSKHFAHFQAFFFHISKDFWCCTNDELMIIGICFPVIWWWYENIILMICSAMMLLALNYYYYYYYY